MPRADFEPTEVIQPGTFEITNNPNAGLIQANVTYVAQAADNVALGADGEGAGMIKFALGKGGETAGVIKYPPDHTQKLTRDTDDESVRLYEVDKQMTVVDEGLPINVNDPSIGQNVVDRHMTTRAVAAHQVDAMIGLNAVAEEKFGVDGEGRMFGLSVMADGAGIQSEFRLDGPDAEKKVCLLDVRLESAALQRGLSDLEVSDYISGQIDRHAGNIFVAQNGKVTGIDNDLAFPSASREHIQQRETDRLGGTINKGVVGMPRQMHAETAQKILATSPDDLRRMLAAITPPDSTAEIPGRLTDAEIEGACQRLADLQKELQHPTGGIQVVPEFNQQTYEAAVDAQKRAFNAVFDQERAGNNRATFDTCDKGPNMDACPKTSYLGSMLLKQQMIAIGLRQDEQANAQRLANNEPPLPSSAAIRPLDTAPAAPRDQVHVEFAKMASTAKQIYKADPQRIENPEIRQQVTALKQQVADVKDKIAHYDKEMAGLEQKKVGSMLRSLASGGAEGRKEFYAEKKTRAQQQLASLERELDAAAAEAVPVAMKEGFMNDARAEVAAQRAALAPQQPNLAYLNQPAPQAPGVAQQQPNLDYLNQPAPQAPGVAQQQPNLAYLNQPAPLPPNNAMQQDGVQQQPANLPNAVENEQNVDEQEVAALDGADDLDGNEVEVKQEDLAKKPSVGDMLKRSNSTPALGGHRQGQGQAQGQDGLKPAGGNSLRASGDWQPAKPVAPAPKPGGLSTSR